ncbi:hypothetical protein APHCR_1547 [Anaplasma phagocytophilum str. CR1007]|nr:hypothetical protein APHCR_1532 [Anaplasma phagocytophilum str. CR1007]KKA00926.1 hypothetical protein APHCR_1547 [Anaplasma phagocytophilum str. CR1007]
MRLSLIEAGYNTMTKYVWKVTPVSSSRIRNSNTLWKIQNGQMFSKFNIL